MDGRSLDRRPLDRWLVGWSRLVRRCLGVSHERGTVVRIWALSALMGGAAIAIIERLPDKGEALRPAGWWLVPVLAVLYGVAERTVFHFEFRREALSFSISEVPTAFALVYLAPWPAVSARIVGSLLIIVLQWRQSLYKLFFNAALFTLELAIAYQFVRYITGRWGDSPATIVVALTIATAISTALSSVFVALVISMVEGGFFERLRGEMRMAGVVAPLNAMVAAAMVAPTLVSPWLAIMSAVPLVAFWALFRGYGNLEQRYRDLDALHGFVRKVGPSLDLAELAGTAAAESATRLRARRSAVVVFDEVNGNRRHDVGDPLPQLPTGVADHRWAAVFAHPEARLLDVTEASAWGLERLARVGEVIVAPITDGGTVLGVLALAERDGSRGSLPAQPMWLVWPRWSTSWHPACARRCCTSASSSRRGTTASPRSPTARRSSGSSTQRIADMDMATPDSDGVLGVVIMMDLDRFKEVNDTLGHHAGDSLLVDFAHRLRASLQPGDVLARLAGDEFAVLCRRTVEGMHQLADALVNDARRPFNIDGLEVVVTMSVGVAPIVGAVNDASTLLRRADIAMYTAKNQHTGYELYRDEIDRRTPARLSMLGDLRNALEHHDLQVHLQPKLDLATGVVIGVEALARWNHPQRGYVSPEDFVHVAEETGLIKQLTDLVLESSVEQLRRLRDHGHHLGLAVNLSTHDLLDELLADRVLRRLDQYEVDPALLTLEITESSLLIDAPRARTTIDRLNRAGIRLSVDDFGTGLLVAQLPAPPAGERAEDRPQLREQPVARGPGRSDREVDHRPGSQPGHAGGGRRRGDRRDHEPPARLRLRRGPRLRNLPPDPVRSVPHLAERHRPPEPPQGPAQRRGILRRPALTAPRT